MRLFTFLIALFCWQQAFSQLDCSANAGPDQTICLTEKMVLSAPFSDDYVPGTIKWTFVNGPQAVSIDQPNAYQTNVSGGPNWATGDYVFSFCARCKNKDGDGTNDEVCDFVTITVMPEIDPPTISPSDITVCDVAELDVSLPDVGQVASVWIDDDGLNLFDAFIDGGKIIIKSKIRKWGSLPKCAFPVHYTISNGGCSSEVVAMVTFRDPFDPDLNGIVKGHAEGTCGREIKLKGDRPGCGAIGTWSVVPSAGVAFTSSNPSTGDATITVPAAGTYTLTYTVSGASPCANSMYTFQHTVVNVNGFDLSPDNQNLVFCDNIVPAGNHCFAFNQLPNTLYNWQVITHLDEVVVSDPHSHAACLVLDGSVDVSDEAIVVTVEAYQFYVDKDCDGPEPSTVVELPFSNYADNLEYINSLKSNPEFCVTFCSDFSIITLEGAPKIELKADTIQFLCSDCSEEIRLRDHYKLTGTAFMQAFVVKQPIGSNFNPLNSVSVTKLLELKACGEYKFKLIATSYDANTGEPLPCSIETELIVIVCGPGNVTAGTDQRHCCNEIFRLNGNNPFDDCGVVGTWKQVNCSPCTATFSDIHDPNTIVYHGLDCDTLGDSQGLCFEWAFESEGSQNGVGACLLKDTACVIIDSCANCPVVKVLTECRDGAVVLTAVDANGAALSTALYDLEWTINGGTPISNVNPITVPYTSGTLYYTLSAKLIYGEKVVCDTFIRGEARCGSEGCGIRLVTSCDACGMIVVTAVDAITGIKIKPQTYENEFYWWINGKQHKDENPIKLAPGSCYRLLYWHYTYPFFPHMPGTWTDICEFETQEICPTLECPGPCEALPNFIVAGYGDATALQLGLVFPGGSFSFCDESNGLMGTLGVFEMPSGAPVDPNLFDIEWKDGSGDTYVTGDLSHIGTVKIYLKESRCCFWEAKYKPVCCETPPTQVRCQFPTIKHCDENGSVTYSQGAPQIIWEGVNGATGYELSVLVGGSEVGPFQTTGTIWPIPSGLTCFTVRVRAIMPEICVKEVWSQPFEYCETAQCEKIIIVCGCCGHERSNEMEAGLRVVELPESVVIELLKTKIGPSWPTIQQAIGKTGIEAFQAQPNPASTNLEVKSLVSGGETFQIFLTDMLQKTVGQAVLRGGASSFLNVEGLPSGIYSLVIKDASGAVRHSQKVAVIR